MSERDQETLTRLTEKYMKLDPREKEKLTDIATGMAIAKESMLSREVEEEKKG